MAKLILTLEGSTIREVPLDKERSMNSRKPSNVIQIENLAVSGEHACIVTILIDSFLEDLGSTNGTFLNSERLASPRKLAVGDEIVLGDKGPSLRILSLAAAVPQRPAPTAYPGPAPSSAPPVPLGGLPAAAHQRRLGLELLTGPSPATEYPPSAPGLQRLILPPQR